MGGSDAATAALPRSDAALAKSVFTGVIQLGYLLTLAIGLWALIGLGVGILIPNQVAALLIAIGVAWIVEPILALVLSIPAWGGDITPYLPSQATSAMLDTVSSGFNGEATAQLTWWGGALVLTAWGAVMAGIGTLRTIRADIS
jgi:hypothetical protein